MPKIYDADGVRFMHPDDWTIERTSDEEAVLQVTALSPATAFWALSVYPGRRDPHGLRDQALEAMQSEYPALEHDPVDTVVEGAPVVGYDLNFCYLDLINSGQVRVFHREQTTCVVLSQAVDHEFEGLEAVFDAMTMSLLNPKLLAATDAYSE